MISFFAKVENALIVTLLVTLLSFFSSRNSNTTTTATTTTTTTTTTTITATRSLFTAAQHPPYDDHYEEQRDLQQQRDFRVLQYLPNKTLTGHQPQHEEYLNVIDLKRRYKYPNGFFFFYHIPKTGGSNFRNNILQIKGVNHCGLSMTWPYDPITDSGIKNFDLLKFWNMPYCQVLCFEAKYLHIQSYVNNFWPSIDKSENQRRDMLVFTFLRRPFDHVRSMISQTYKQFLVNENATLSKSCLKGPLKNFYNPASSDLACSAYSMSNAQVALLGGGSLMNAKTVVDKLFAFGLNSWYEESICLFQFQLGQFNKEKCTCQYISEKRLDKREGSAYPSPHDDFRFSDADIYDIGEVTLADDALYIYSARIFYKRIKYVEKKTGVQVLCANSTLKDLMSR